MSDSDPRYRIHTGWLTWLVLTGLPQWRFFEELPCDIRYRDQRGGEEP